MDFTPPLFSPGYCVRAIPSLCSPDNKMKKPNAPLDFLTTYDPVVADLALALRQILLEEVPDAVEKVFANHPSAVWFGFGTKMQEPKMADMFCYIAAASKHVNLGFCHGASLSDPNHVMEGEGKRMRHVKFRIERDLERPFVRRYIRAAMENSQSAPTKSLGRTFTSKPIPPA